MTDDYPVVKLYSGKPGYIVIECPQYLFRTLRGTAGARWEPSRLRGTAPATPAVVYSIVRRLESMARFEMSTKVSSLLQAHLSLKKRQVIKHAAIEDLTPIPITNSPPWEHQTRAFNFAKGLPAVLLDMGMGTGKTKTAIDLIQNQLTEPILIVSPKSVIEDVWEVQLLKHWESVRRTDLNIGFLNTGSIAQRAKVTESVLSSNGVRILVTNYDVVWRDPLASVLMSQGHWGWILLDESHRIKKPGGKASNFLFRLGLLAEHRIIMTGTLMPRNPFDVYAQFRFLDCGIFGTNFAEFQSEYAVMGGFNNYQVIGWKNQDKLRKKIYSVGIRIDESVLRLPEPVDVWRHSELEPEAKKIYKELDKEMVVGVEEETITVSNALAKFTRLQQITCGYITIPPEKEGDVTKKKIISTARIDLLREILEDIDPNEPLVIFARFKPDMDNIIEVCKEQGRGVAEISGKKQEKKIWDAGDAEVLVVQIQAGREGLDFTRSRYCIFYSINFSLGDYLQARKRINRPGQQNNLVCIHLGLKGTIDTKIFRALQQKKEIIDYLQAEYGIKR